MGSEVNFSLFWCLGFSVGKQVWSLYLRWPRQLTEDQSNRFPQQPTALHLGGWIWHAMVNSYLHPEARAAGENHSSPTRHCSRQRWLWTGHWLGLGRFSGFLRTCSWGSFSWQILSMVCLWYHSKRFSVGHPADDGSQSQVDVQEWCPVAEIPKGGCVVLSWSSFLDTTPWVLWHGSWCSWPLCDPAELRLAGV